MDYRETWDRKRNELNDREKIVYIGLHRDRNQHAIDHIHWAYSLIYVGYDQANASNTFETIQVGATGGRFIYEILSPGIFLLCIQPGISDFFRATQNEM